MGTYLTSEMPALPPGTRVGGLEIEALLGRGAFGAVYRVRDLRHNLPLALKLLPPQLLASRTFTARACREIRVGMSLAHDHVVRVLEIVRAPPLLGFTMEYVDGHSLATLLFQRGALKAPHVVPLLFQLATGLAALHRVGLVHRDLKPANIVVTPDHRIVIIDLGLVAPVLTQAEGASAEPLCHPTLLTDLTDTDRHRVAGTPRYLAPEMLRGQGIDARADIHAFGLIAYELLMGRCPFSAATFQELCIEKLRADVELPVLSNAHHGALREIVNRCLLRDPEQRFRDGERLREALRPLLLAYPKDHSPLAERAQRASTATSRRRFMLSTAPGLRSIVHLIDLLRYGGTPYLTARLPYHYSGSEVRRFRGFEVGALLILLILIVWLLTPRATWLEPILSSATETGNTPAVRDAAGGKFRFFTPRRTIGGRAPHNDQRSSTRVATDRK